MSFNSILNYIDRYEKLLNIHKVTHKQSAKSNDLFLGLPEEIFYHINHRFDTLQNILKLYSDVKILVPYSEDDKKADSKREIPYGHSLGTGLAVLMWNKKKNGQLYSKNVISLILFKGNE